jgi:F420-non-reducing hydrogenase small subunit
VEAEPIWFEPGQRIYDQGDAADEMYIILDGVIEYGAGSGEDRYVLFRLRPGDYFGETELLIDRPRTGSATAVERTQLMPIPRAQFLERIGEQPELTLFFLQSLSVRMQNLGAILANPRTSIAAIRQNWRPLMTKAERVKVALVSLSTCAGCSAVFLDPDILGEVSEAAEIVYCPMLIDRDHFEETDVALVDGAVRLKEDEEKLEEARAKSRFVVAWGTCASFGGVPAHANQYELEDLIKETYGHAYDTYAYYLSGASGVEGATYQEEGVSLLRKAYAVDDVVRVDYYVPGCPPVPGSLLQLLAELTGQHLKGAKPIVCAECGRRPAKRAVESLDAFPQEDETGTCFHSLGVLCLGLMTKGGCAAVCTRNGLPCWGCRGPAQVTLKKMAAGESFEEVVIGRLVKRCRMEEGQLKPAVKLLRKRGHGLFDFERNFMSSLARIR